MIDFYDLRRMNKEEREKKLSSLSPPSTPSPSLSPALSHSSSSFSSTSSSSSLSLYGRVVAHVPSPRTLLYVRILKDITDVPLSISGECVVCLVCALTFKQGHLVWMKRYHLGF